MKKTLFSEEQIVVALKQVEAGVPIKDICPKYDISQPTLYA